MISNYRPLFRLALFLVALCLASTSVSAQTEENQGNTSESTNKINKWNITLNGGATLLWGDLSDEPSNPFSKYFSDQQGIGYGLMISRRLGSSFTANLQYLGGTLQGYRSSWSNGDPADLSFKTQMNDFNFNVEVDLLNLILENKERRWFSAYLKGGIGYLLYNPVVTHTSDGSAVFSGNGSSIEIPWGWGVRSDIAKHWSIRFENTFHHALVDDVDGHGTEYSFANDIYNYTSLGMTYRIYQKPKQPKQPRIIDVEPVDTLVAEADSAINFELSVASNIPSNMYANDTSEVILRINKGPIEGVAKLQQTIPEGFAVESISSAGAVYDFKNQIITYAWAEIPSQEIVILKYRLISRNANEGEFIIPGILFYQQNNIEQVRQFKKTLTIAANPIIAQSNSVVVNQSQIINETNNTNSNKPATNAAMDQKKLVYRVQVYAVYGGTTSGKLLQKRLNLDHEVTQTYQGNYSKYTSGEFATYEEATAYKNKLRNSTVPGAFVVGFYEGERINNIQDAISIEKNGVPSTSPILSKGLTYRIQIAASNKNLSVDDIGNQTGVTETISKTTHQGLFKYEVGNYTNYEEAKKAMLQLRDKVSDAFIVKYKDGTRL